MRALTHCLHTGSRTSTLCSLTQISTILLLHPFVFPNRSILVTDVLVLAQQYYFLARALRHPARYQTCPLRNLTNSLSNMPPSYCVHKCGHVHTSHTRVIPKSYASHIRKSYTSHMRVIHKSLIVMCSRQEKINFFSEKSFQVIHKSYESHIKVICKSYKSHTKLFRVPTHNFLQVIYESYVSHTRVINRDEQQVIHESYTSH